MVTSVSPWSTLGEESTTALLTYGSILTSITFQGGTENEVIAATATSLEAQGATESDAISLARLAAWEFKNDKFPLGDTPLDLYNFFVGKGENPAQAAESLQQLLLSLGMDPTLATQIAEDVDGGVAPDQTFLINPQHLFQALCQAGETPERAQAVVDQILIKEGFDPVSASASALLARVNAREPGDMPPPLAAPGPLPSSRWTPLSGSTPDPYFVPGPSADLPTPANLYKAFIGEGLTPADAMTATYYVLQSLGYGQAAAYEIAAEAGLQNGAPAGTTPNGSFAPPTADSVANAIDVALGGAPTVQDHTLAAAQSYANVYAAGFNLVISASQPSGSSGDTIPLGDIYLTLTSTSGAPIQNDNGDYVALGSVLGFAKKFNTFQAAVNQQYINDLRSSSDPNLKRVGDLMYTLMLANTPAFSGTINTQAVQAELTQLTSTPAIASGLATVFANASIEACKQVYGETPDAVANEIVAFLEDPDVMAFYMDTSVSPSEAASRQKNLSAILEMLGVFSQSGLQNVIAALITYATQNAVPADTVSEGDVGATLGALLSLDHTLPNSLQWAATGSNRYYTGVAGSDLKAILAQVANLSDTNEYKLIMSALGEANFTDYYALLAWGPSRSAAIAALTGSGKSVADATEIVEAFRDFSEICAGLEDKAPTAGLKADVREAFERLKEVDTETQEIAPVAKEIIDTAKMANAKFDLTLFNVNSAKLLATDSSALTAFAGIMAAVGSTIFTAGQPDIPSIISTAGAWTNLGGQIANLGKAGAQWASTIPSAKPAADALAKLATTSQLYLRWLNPTSTVLLTAESAYDAITSGIKGDTVDTVIDSITGAAGLGLTATISWSYFAEASALGPEADAALIATLAVLTALQAIFHSPPSESDIIYDEATFVNDNMHQYVTIPNFMQHVLDYIDSITPDPVPYSIV